MRTVVSKEQQSAHGRWTWVAPIMSWTKADCEEYINTHDLPRNPVVEKIHRSGECFCGAYANRVEELVVLEIEYPEHCQRLLEIEERVQDEIGVEEDYCWRGGGSLTSEQLKQLSDEPESRMVLCQDCEYN